MCIWKISLPIIYQIKIICIFKMFLFKNNIMKELNIIKLSVDGANLVFFLKNEKICLINYH